LQQIKANPAYASRIHSSEFGIRHAIIYNRNTAGFCETELTQRIQHAAIVHPVGRRLHDHIPRRANPGLQKAVIRDSRIAGP
jgi:hypothetical protein